MHLQLDEILRQVCKEEKINNYSYEVHGGNKVGEGFLGEITFLTLTDESSGKAYNLVVKKAFQQEEKRKRHQIRHCFLREVYLYTKVWKKFVDLQTEILDCKKDIFNCVFKCFATSVEDKNEFLVLDNGKKLGYDLVSKKFILDSNHLELIFKNYARFHSLSYVMQQRKPAVFQEIQSNIPNFFIDLFDEEGVKFAENIFVLAKQTLLPQDDKKYFESKLDDYMKNWMQFFENPFYENAKFKAIIHGDCWSNNMMFKYDKNKKPEDLKLLDWQLSYYGSPICDLSYFFYSGTNKEHYDQLDRYLEIYYQTFEDNLRKMKYDFSLNPIPTLDDLKEDWKKYCKFGFVMALMIIRMKAMNEDEINDLVEINPETGIKLEDKVSDTEVNKRFRGLLLHLKEIDAL